MSQIGQHASINDINVEQGDVLHLCRLLPVAAIYWDLQFQIKELS